MEIVICERSFATVSGVADWTFLTNHAHVLIYVARHPDARISEIAAAVGVTERAAQRIVAELAEAGYLTRTRVGRRNRYSLHPELPLRHPLEQGHAVGTLLEALIATDAESERARA